MFSKEQLHLINLAIQTNEDKSARSYGISELSTANDIFQKIKKQWKDNDFVDGEIGFTTEEKVFILKLVKDRKWTAIDAEFIFSIIKTLE